MEIPADTSIPVPSFSSAKPGTLLKQLEHLRDKSDKDSWSAKLDLLRELERRCLGRATEVFRLHECLCFLQAYPDNAEVLRQVQRMLEGFSERPDLRHRRGELADTGIAGTRIDFSFYWFTALWLARRWPDRITVDWSAFDNRSKILDLLGLLLPYSETLALDAYAFSAREWINLLKGPAETDAAFIIRRFAALCTDAFGRENAYDSLDIPIRLEPGPQPPSRTHARYYDCAVVFPRGVGKRGRPSLRREFRLAPEAVRAVPTREARQLIDLAREAMVVRSRDFDIFIHADQGDVRLVIWADGLQFACMGAIPERRLLLESVYGFLTLKNGVPIGYGLASALYGSSEVAYNVFDTFRGAESASVYLRFLATAHHLFWSDTFTVDPYQLGHENPEGLKSGAWWFYYKLGLRPDDPDVRRIARREVRKMKSNPRHRSSIGILKTLAAEPLFLDTRSPRRVDVLGRIDLGAIGLRITRTLAERFGSDREKAIRVCSDEAAALLGVRSWRRLRAGERLAWMRWSPLVMTLPGIQRWSPKARRDLVRVIRAKGGRRESEFVGLFDIHVRLRNALLNLAE